jgi:hypothetical protein
MPDVLENLLILKPELIPSFSKLDFHVENGKILFDKNLFVRFLESTTATPEEIAIVCTSAYTVFYSLMVWYVLWNAMTGETNKLCETLLITTPVDPNKDYFAPPASLQ